jgi:hypothetical protein
MATPRYSLPATTAPRPQTIYLFKIEDDDEFSTLGEG